MRPNSTARLQARPHGVGEGRTHDTPCIESAHRLRARGLSVPKPRRPRVQHLARHDRSDQAEHSRVLPNHPLPARPDADLRLPELQRLPMRRLALRGPRVHGRRRLRSRPALRLSRARRLRVSAGDGARRLRERPLRRARLSRRERVVGAPRSARSARLRASVVGSNDDEAEHVRGADLVEHPEDVGATAIRVVVGLDGRDPCDGAREPRRVGDLRAKCSGAALQCP